MKTSQARQQPESGCNRAHDRAQRIPRIGAAHGRTFSGIRSGIRSRTHRRLRPGDQQRDRRKIKSEDDRRGQHGEGAGDELGEDQAAKRFVRGAQNRRQNFDQAREENQEREGRERRESLRECEGHAGVVSWRRLHRSNSALPRTIPARNVPSISVNAYVELPSCVESRRVQPIS